MELSLRAPLLFRFKISAPDCHISLLKARKSRRTDDIPNRHCEVSTMTPEVCYIICLFFVFFKRFGQFA